MDKDTTDSKQSQDSTPLVHPVPWISGRTVKAKPARRPANYFLELLHAAEEAAEWLVECPEGSDQRQRGLRLQNAIRKAKREP